VARRHQRPGRNASGHGETRIRGTAFVATKPARLRHNSASCACVHLRHEQAYTGDTDRPAVRVPRRRGRPNRTLSRRADETCAGRDVSATSASTRPRLRGQRRRVGPSASSDCRTAAARGLGRLFGERLGLVRDAFGARKQRGLQVLLDRLLRDHALGDVPP